MPPVAGSALGKYSLIFSVFQFSPFQFSHSSLLNVKGAFFCQMVACYITFANNFKTSVSIGMKCEKT